LNTLDPTDLKILLELIRDPRVQIGELSEKLGIARNTAQSRVRRMLRSGILHDGGREIDLEAVGYDVVAFVTIEVTHRELDGVIAALRLIPQVLAALGRQNRKGLPPNALHIPMPGGLDSIYVAGDSLVHRAPAGVKLAALLVLGAAVIWLDQPWQIGAALLAAVLGYLAAGLTPVVALRQVRPLWPLLAATAVLHLLLGSWQRAVVVTGTIVLLVLLAALVTLTTRTTALVDVVVAASRPLRRFGVDVDRLGLMVALGIRCIPVVVAIAGQIREAQRARGVTGARAYAVPFVVRALRHADALGDALVARGVDD